MPKVKNRNLLANKKVNIFIVKLTKKYKHKTIPLSPNFDTNAITPKFSLFRD